MSTSSKTDDVRWGTPQWFEANEAERAAFFSRKLDLDGTEDPTAYFGYAANGYQLNRIHDIAEFVRLHVPTPMGRVLDVGCATGDVTDAVGRAVSAGEIIAIDFSEAVIEKARERFPHIRFALGVLPRIDQPSDHFDLVVASEVLYYLSAAQRSQAVAAIARVLKPQGWLLFTSAHGAIQYFTPGSARALLASAFEVRAVQLRHLGIYHRAAQLLYMLDRLRRYAVDGDDYLPSSRAAQKIVVGFAPLLHVDAVQSCLTLLSRASRRALTERRLPRWIEQSSARWVPKWTTSGFFLLAQKRTGR